MSTYRVLYISTPEELGGVIPEIRKLYEKDSLEYPEIVKELQKSLDGMTIVILNKDTKEWVYSEQFFNLIDIREFVITESLKLGDYK